MRPSSRRLGSRQSLQDSGRSSRKNKRRGGESQPHQVGKIVDSFRSANDEVRSANDEVRSANDEVRSANDEVRDVRQLSVESRARDYYVR